MSGRVLIATFFVVASVAFFWQRSINAPATDWPAASNPGALTALADDTHPSNSNRIVGKSEARQVPDHDAVSISKDDEQLKTLLRLSKRNANMVEPTNREISRFEELFLDTLQQQPPLEQLRSLWSSEGWLLTRWDSNGQSFVAISEPDNDRRGRGFYVIRVGSKSNLVLQAPHRFYDSKTGIIARKLFTEHDCRAAAWNTVHRKQYDLAHRSNHFINAFTRALIKFDSETVIAQLHGFANENQKGSAGTAEIILSDTTQYPGRPVRTVAVGLKQNFGTQWVRLYPLEVSQLGGTKNEQGRVARQQGSVGFLHIELNKNVREKLAEFPSLRARLYESLAAASLISTDSHGP